MSASLVGSEMCIRDRYTLLGSFLTPLYASQAVSYTHLTLPTTSRV
ncbi:hypothetical protein JMUB7546_26780 [Staphylococcus aureus]